MENSQKKKRKVKDIFAPHELNNYSSGQKQIETEEIPIRFINKVKIERKIEDTKNEENITVAVPSFREKWIKKEKTVDKKFKILLGVFFALVLFYYLGFVLLAKAEVNITTKKIEMPFSGTILVDRNVFATNFSQAVLPGNLFVFKADKTQEFSSTGQGKDEREAKGIITIYNNYSTSPQILVATTRFENPDHKIFRLDSRIVVPGASTKNGKLIPSTIDVKVTADEAGPDYNIDACNLPDCKFTIPGLLGEGESKFNGFYGVSTKEMTGGSFGSVPLVTSGDLKNAEEIILETVMGSIEQDLQNKIPKELKVLSEAKSGIKITNVDSDAEIDDSREKFTVSAEGEVNIIAFNENDIIEYIQAMLDEDKDENYEYCQKPELEYLEFKTDFDDGTLKMLIKTNQMVCHKLSLDEIKQTIVGKSRGELDKIFESNPGIKEVEVKLWPLWIKRVPKSLKKINFFID
ncbi:MAG TPA: hypothetical protein VFD40_01290 [Candidatus Paceibacterota bacterium]|nr:hypothetical protein [Candidatus Paceibacterota bacterium]